MVRICTLGREQLGSLAGHVDLGLADSEFNRLELEALGFRRTGVLPIYLDFRRYREAPNPVLRRMLDDGLTNLLFVGRLAPNKRPEDLVRLAAYWRKVIAPDVRLILVGKWWPRGGYFDRLQAFAYELDFTPWEVVFLGHVDHDDLLSCYAAAHVFVSMSEHEGFGVPFVESMLMRVPVLAYSAAAVPHTLGGSGVQFTRKDLAEVGEMAHLLATDAALRERGARRAGPPPLRLRSRRPWSRRCAATWSRCEHGPPPAADGRPALRARDHRGLGVARARGRGAARRGLRGDRVHHLRPRLRDVA